MAEASEDNLPLDLLEDGAGYLRSIPKLRVPLDKLTINESNLLGEGGCGKVYCAEHKDHGPMAFKKLTGNLYPNK